MTKVRISTVVVLLLSLCGMQGRVPITSARR